MTTATYSLRPGDYRLLETTPPAVEPVTLSDLKTHLRLSGTAEDDDLQARLTAARVVCETQVGKYLISRSLSLFLDRWPAASSHKEWWEGTREGVMDRACPPLHLPVTPLAAIEGIYIYDAGGVAAAIDTGLYETDLMGGRLSFKAAPPAPGRALNGIEIRLIAGFGEATAVPAVFKQAIKQIAAHLYTYRGDVAEQALLRSGAAALLAPYKDMSLS